MSKGWLQLAALAAVLTSGPAFANAYDPGHWNMPVGVTEISKDVYSLHMLIFWVCVVIAVLVFGVMFYSVFAHRKSRHPKPTRQRPQAERWRPWEPEAGPSREKRSAAWLRASWSRSVRLSQREQECPRLHPPQPSR